LYKFFNIFFPNMLIMCPAKSVPNSSGFSVEPKNDENF